MVVHDLDRVGALIGPDKTDAPLTVDAQRMLSGAVSTERFQVIALRKP